MRFTLDLYVVAISVNVGRSPQLCLLVTPWLGLDVDGQGVSLFAGRRCLMLGDYGFGSRCRVSATEGIREQWFHLTA